MCDETLAEALLNQLKFLNVILIKLNKTKAKTVYVKTEN